MDFGYLKLRRKGQVLFAADAFSSFLTKVVFSIGLLFIGLILALPAILLGIATLGLALIPMIIFGVILLLIFTAYMGTFGSSVWTIGFMQMTAP